MKVKRLLSFILSVFMLNYILPVVGESLVADEITALATGQKYSYGSYEFIITSNGIEITKFDNDVPLSTLDMLDSIPVNGSKIRIYSLGERSFYNDRFLVTVNIAPYVKKICSYAFAYSGNLKEVNLPSGLTTIEADAFSNCENLTNITIPSSVTSIGANAFKDTPWLLNKKKANSLVVVNKIVIDGTACSGDVKIPDGVKTIGSLAFSGCKSLSSITIPASVKQIESDAFVSSGLREIRGYSGSKAEAFANKKGYSFVSIDSDTTTTTTTTTTTKKSTTTTTTTGLQSNDEEILYELTVGQKIKLEFDVPNLTYKSSNTNSVVVSVNGMVTAIGEGKAIVSVIDTNGNVVLIKITVNPEETTTTTTSSTTSTTTTTTTPYQYSIINGREICITGHSNNLPAKIDIPPR